MNSNLDFLDDLENLEDDEFGDEGKPFKSINDSSLRIPSHTNPNYQSKYSSNLFSSIN